MADLFLVSTTTASREDAERLGRTLVDERLAACAQVLGPLTSYYRWQGRIESATEWYCHLKTTAELYPALESRLKALHSYETPEIVAVPAERSSPAYTAWVAESVRPGR